MKPKFVVFLQATLVDSKGKVLCVKTKVNQMVVTLREGDTHADIVPRTVRQFEDCFRGAEQGFIGRVQNNK